MRTLTSEQRYALWLFHSLGSNARQFKKLTLFYETASAVFDAASHGERIETVAEQVSDRIQASANLKELDDISHLADSDAFGLLFEDDKYYPGLLKNISDAPPVLFYMGNPERECAFPFGIVGSRRCTPYGKDMATRFASELCEQGITVVSGLADGIDSCAAKGALSAHPEHLPTVGVLGCGIDIVYPAANKAMYELVRKEGLILTEYFPGDKPLREHFPARNRIISGMSHGLLVVEAAERSGTSITAGLALEQGRDVFAIPGRITDVASMGTNRMIRDGEAKPVLCAEDILTEYAFGRIEPVRPAFEPDTLPKEQRTVYDLLVKGEKTFDELAALTGYPVPILNSVLTEMQFLGIMKQLPGRIYMVDLANI